MNKAQGYVLIVEDDPDILSLLKTTLTISGYRVLTAHNGREGLDVARKECPGLVLADIMMPRMDGFALVNRLRIDPQTRNIPVVVMTATYVSPEDREFVQNISATRFIQKPIDLEKLLATVDELMEHGTSSAREPLKDFDFYIGYRKRLEVKLEQKNAQIARDQNLLNTSRSDQERRPVQVSLDRALNDRDELRTLLAQVHEQLKRY